MRLARLLLPVLLLPLPLPVARPSAALTANITIRISKRDRPAPQLAADGKISEGTVTIGSRPIGYQAVAGAVAVHPEGWKQHRSP